MKTVYLPVNLDLAKLLKKHPPTFIYDIEDFKYLIGTVVRLKAEIKSNTEEKASEYVELNAQLLQKRIRNYNRCLEYLLEHNVLKRDYYIAGEKSYGYKLSLEYTTKGYKPDALTKLRLIKKDRHARLKEEYIKRRYRHLVKWFDDDLQIDYDAAKACLQTLLEQEQQQKRKKALEKYHLRMLSVERLRSKEFKYTVDDTSRRFHSNLTNLKSELRNYITYNGQELSSIDVKNSQPFISTVLLRSAFYQKEKGSLNLFSISRHLFRSIAGVIPQILSILPSSYIMLVKSHESEARSDFELYCTLVDKGRLYQYLNEKYDQATGIRFNLEAGDEKRRFKKLFFNVFYAQNDMHHKNENYPFRKVFIEQFPNVYNVFALLKSHEKRTMAVILQSIEAEIIINRVTRRIAKEFPKLPIFTIHDNVVTLSENAEYVRDVIKQEFETAIGLQPSLHIERWTPPE